jgi:hypothetical protein
MSRVRLMLIALGLAFALPALAGTSAPEPPIPDAVCASERQPDHDDPKWRWRLRAFHHLDCITSVVDEALQSAPTTTTMIQISRHDLERIRTSTNSARDAAARIGQ